MSELNVPVSRTKSDTVELFTLMNAAVGEYTEKKKRSWIQSFQLCHCANINGSNCVWL